jgi:pimeloyl-ACP methyl ester carboxylesterase
MLSSDLRALSICMLLAGASAGCPRLPEASSVPAPSNTQETEMIMRTHVMGDGPPLVLVGGGLTGWSSWIPHQERLASSRRVARAQPLVVQLGLDDRPLPANYSVDLESAALISSLDAFHSTGPNDLAAWSFGGFIALESALDHPERIRTLTLVEPPAFWVLQAAGDPTYERERQAVWPLAERLREDVSETDLEAFVRYASLCPPNMRPQDLPQWPVWVEHRRSLRRQFDVEFGHHRHIDDLQGFERPVLLVKGRGSTPALHRIVDVLAENLPNARVLELDGGHAPHIVEIDRFLDELIQFHADAGSREGSRDRPG